MGTSAGAITGSLYASGLSPKQVAEELSRLPPSAFLVRQQVWLMTCRTAQLFPGRTVTALVARQGSVITEHLAFSLGSASFPLRISVLTLDQLGTGVIASQKAVIVFPVAG